MSAGGPRAAGSRPGERPGERERWDSLDGALSTLRTCRSAAELAECACELAMQACGAAAAAVERVTDGISVPWLRAGRVELLDPSLAGPAVAREVVMASIVVNDVVAGSLHVAGSDLCPDIVESYARALGSMFALVGVRRRAEEQRYALARLRHGLAEGGERPVELIDAATDLRATRHGAPSMRVSSSALRARLTARQREVLDLMVAGLSNAEIADRLVVALPTVKSHVRAVLRASGAVNRSDAVARFSRG